MLRSKPFSEQKCNYCGKMWHTAFRCPIKAKDKAKDSIITHSKATGGHKNKKMYNLSNHSNNRRSDAIRRLDTICSKVVRITGSTNGRNSCYTCGRYLPWKDLDCGHFISRRFISTRFDLNNMRPQCRHCNRDLHGNLDVYRQKLTLELGEDRIAELHRKTYNKLDTFSIESMIPAMERKLAEISVGIY